MQLTEHKWKVFAFTDIFVIRDGYYNKKPPFEPNGNIPFLGATQYDNGITGFYTLPTIHKYDKVGTTVMNDKERRVFPGNCIAITNNGSVGNAYYQVSEFTCSHDITPIYLKPRTLNRYIALFLIPLIMKSGESFEYAKKWRPKRMRKSKLILPVSADGTPDWLFMESYMRQTEQQILQPTLKQLCNRLIINTIMGGGKTIHPNWKEFVFSEIFTDIQRGKRLKKADHLKGNIPYVSSTATNNGVDNFIDNEDGVRKFANCLTIANSGSVGYAFFHSYEFIASDHVTQLKREGLDKYAYLFMIPIITKLSQKYSFNREINDIRIRREKLLLPATPDGQPDFAFMSSFMKQVEQDILHATLPILQSRLNTYKNATGGVKLNKQNWKEFIISDIFSISSGVRLTAADMSAGNMPFIGASDNNNGITAWVGNTNASLDEDVLGVNYNGSVCETFYHPYKCLFSDDVKRLHYKQNFSKNTSKYIYLFLKQTILQQKTKYAYGYKFNAQRMSRQTILLPATSDGEPDYDFMEAYMRNLESEQITRYLSTKLFKS